MIRIDIEHVWTFRRDGDAMRLALGFLTDIHTTGKITVAARNAGISYRHGWNLLEKWGAFFGTPLVVRQRGRGTTLTPFGERLVWAGERFEARLGPLLENLSQELETEINQLLPSHPNVLRVHASHGFAVPKLRELLNEREDIGADFRYVSNENSLVSLAQNECDLAGMHLPQGALRQRSIELSRGWLKPQAHRAISFVTREMGLMVRKDNPLNITWLSDLTREDVRFVNRDADSGTRLLLELMLTEADIDPSRISGYVHGEYTHAAVAAYVASGMADVAFGVEAAARYFNLDFVRLLTEDYYFVCRRETLELEAVKAMLEIMRGDVFRREISNLPGYSVRDPGSTRTIDQVLQRVD
jgi:molybdate transport repressor ModE-like protein